MFNKILQYKVLFLRYLQTTLLYYKDEYHGEQKSMATPQP